LTDAVSVRGDRPTPRTAWLGRSWSFVDMGVSGGRSGTNHRVTEDTEEEVTEENQIRVELLSPLCGWLRSLSSVTLWFVIFD
jgi:hypothetical protein